MLDPDASRWSGHNSAHLGGPSRPLSPSPTDAIPHGQPSQPPSFPQNSGRRWATDSTSAATIATLSIQGPCTWSPLRRNNPRRLIRSRWVLPPAATTLALCVTRRATRHLARRRRDPRSFFTADELACVSTAWSRGTAPAPRSGGPRELRRQDPLPPGSRTPPTAVPCHSRTQPDRAASRPRRLRRAALGTDDVRMYQCHTWAKFTGQTDFDQPFHCDYKNHTLTVQGRSRSHDQLHDLSHRRHRRARSDPLCAGTGVGSDHGPDAPPVRRWAADYEAQLRAIERAALRLPGRSSPTASTSSTWAPTSPCPTPIATVTASYKAAGNDQIGWSARLASSVSRGTS